jgi:hypothetical protein
MSKRQTSAPKWAVSPILSLLMGCKGFNLCLNLNVLTANESQLDICNFDHHLKICRERAATSMAGQKK